ncbi:MAG TPA: pseudaminic acid cytidylyltransferase [Aquaticitalea sp.]|nr:pseudaminic acid cytidylyltransferase [Aquaticitalea sp.]HNU58833.1 pseudaminic acid cytidylyltransferase [Aquaticitalea sp.]
MERIAIIPARGGSKRIPRKNIKDFLGKPIISYTIEAALQSKMFSEIMVSTDDESIADIARTFGASVPFLRSSNNANDHATTFEVIEEVLLRYKSKGMVFGEACCIYPTAPFTTPQRLKQFHEFLDTSNFDCVFPVLKYGYPIQRGLQLSDHNQMRMISPEHLVTRSQDLTPSYHDAGQFYWFRVDRLLQFGQLWTDNTGALEINEMEAHDIDNLDDWEIAEFKYQLFQKKKVR